MNVSISHVVSTIKAKFTAEGLMKFFTIRPYTFVSANGLLSLDSDNCILLEFPTPYAEYPEIYKSHTYRLLIAFSLYEETRFSPVLQSAIRRLQDKDNIDRIVLWSGAEIDQYIIQALKMCNTDLIFVHIPSVEEVLKTKTLAYFVPIEGSNLEYSLTINLISESLIKRLKKMFHLVLSEVGAPIYDKHYKKIKIATASFMDFEERKLAEIIHKLKTEGRNKIAVDLGCGTGRHSFVLAKFFKNVYSYDFSPRMIVEANARKKKEDITNILFSVNDFEYEKFLEESELCGECDLIVASFGMGSFIEETSVMLRRFYNWLKPNGCIFVSFYNANAITLNVNQSWRDVSLSAQIDKDNNSLEVSLTPKIKFNIFCKLFDEGIRGEINRIFNIDEIVTYPTIMALLPNSLLDNDLTKECFKRADEVISSDQESDYAHLGYYIMVTAYKAGSVTHGYQNIIRILQAANATYEVLEHEPVFSMEDVIREVGNFPSCMIKTLIFKNKKTEGFIVIAVQSEKQIDKVKIAALLDTSTNKMRFATEKEVQSVGFPVGGVAPFGFEENTDVVRFIDGAIALHSCEWLYTGIGDNQKTLKIKKQDFLEITSDYRRIEL